uniref:cysteine-rich receptor-like protein kinase 10 isoform X2 n=1 Tax=Fragaria vesca subsp. vesca TaxID=101020 RepID=UPI0005CA5277|nr:PREDICTED: cysteine-rich receptor-like protein kinase 10 isoform X2 [Fragaria vesca subsp. vesca]
MNFSVLFQSSLIPLLLITFFLSINFQLSVCADTAEYGNCSLPITCGSVKSNISYPFWGGNRPYYCGRSGFEVTCNGTVPLITMRDINFRILDMKNISSTTSPTVKVARDDYWETICPSTYVATNLNLSLFSYSSDSLNVSFWYNCNTSISALGNSLACNNTVTVSYLTAAKANVITIDPVSSGACKAAVLVPVSQSSSVALDSEKIDIEAAIDGGFELDVLNADPALCSSCLASGGACGANSTGANEFMCFCQTTSSSTQICTLSTVPTPAGKKGLSVNSLKRTLVIAIVSAAVGFLTITFGYFLWKKKFGRISRVSGNTSKVTAGGGKNDTELPLFSLRSILAATNNFSEGNKLGEGGFGPVYKGILPENQEAVAIKRLSKKSGQGHHEFMNELKLIAKLQHTNLARLLGCCMEEDELILIYEYMPNRSLDKLLFDPCEKTKLDWGTRFRIIQVSDFGMARIFDINQIEANTNKVVGTYGYMSPEYALYGHFSEKLDVFSFGVLLLEIVSGKKNALFYYCENSQTLAQWIWQLWKVGREMEVIDASVRETSRIHEALRCIHVGLLCVQEAPADRPTMSSVIHMLEVDEATSLPLSKEPAFSTSRISSPVTTYSKNVVTITLPEPR